MSKMPYRIQKVSPEQKRAAGLPGYSVLDTESQVEVYTAYRNNEAEAKAYCNDWVKRQKEREEQEGSPFDV